MSLLPSSSSSDADAGPASDSSRAWRFDGASVLYVVTVSLLVRFYLWHIMIDLRHSSSLQSFPGCLSFNLIVTFEEQSYCDVRLTALILKHSDNLTSRNFRPSPGAAAEE